MTPSGVCYVLAAMDPGETFTRKKGEGDIVIAADAGLRYAERIGLSPDFVIGDFDSLGYIPVGIESIVFPKEKDDTDTMLAVRYGMKSGYKKFVLVGAVGGRPDHSFANIQTLSFIAKNGGIGMIDSDGFSMVALGKSVITFPKESKGNLSVFSLSEKSVVSISGLKYHADSIEIGFDFPVGVSNEFVGVESSIVIRSGMVIIMSDQPMNFEMIGEI